MKIELRCHRSGALTLWLAVAAALLIGAVAQASAATEDEIKAFVERVNSASTALVSSDDGAEQRCRELLSSAFDVPAMAQFALGKAWDKASEADRAAFLAAFEDGVVTAYLRRMRDWRGAAMSFVGTRAPSGGYRLAASRLVLPDAQETWVWKLRPDGTSWRIVDVAIDGSSVLNVERQEYADILAANHGDINAVIAYIRKRIARGESK